MGNKMGNGQFKSYSNENLGYKNRLPLKYAGVKNGHKYTPTTIRKPLLSHLALQANAIFL